MLESTPPATPRRAGTLVRGAFWNLWGYGLPLVVGVCAVPPLVSGLGVERFGVLTLAWALIGYFSLFDLGLGRALTRLVAERSESERPENLAPLVWTALAFLGGLGAVGGGALGLGAPWLVDGFLHVPPRLREEVITSFYVIAFAIPLTVLTSGLRGILEARFLFFSTSALKTGLGVFTFCAPLAAMHFSPTLTAATYSLLALRAISVLAHYAVCWRAMPATMSQASFDGKQVVPLLRFGGWITVTNVISPMLVYLDRFVIGSVLSIGAIAYYVTPFEIVTKLLAVPAAFSAVVFPTIASKAPADDVRAVLRFFAYCVLAILAPIVVLATALANPALELWLGHDFAIRSAPVLQWLAIGVLVNSFGYLAISLVQGSNRPRWVALLHCAEAIVYVPLLLVLTVHYGVAGAALGWTLRVGVDAAMLCYLGVKVVPSLREVAKEMGWAMALLLPVCAVLAQARVAWPIAVAAAAGTSMLALLCIQKDREMRPLLGALVSGAAPKIH